MSFLISLPTNPPQPNMALYPISMLYTLPVPQGSLQYTALYGVAPAPVDLTRLQKLWRDDSIDPTLDPNADCPYLVVRPVGGKLVQVTMTIPAWEAATENMLPANLSIGSSQTDLMAFAAKPYREIPTRLLLKNETLIQTLTGVWVQRTDMGSTATASTGTGQFTADQITALLGIPATLASMQTELAQILAGVMKAPPLG